MGLWGGWVYPGWVCRVSCVVCLSLIYILLDMHVFSSHLSGHFGSAVLIVGRILIVSKYIASCLNI